MILSCHLDIKRRGGQIYGLQTEGGLPAEFHISGLDLQEERNQNGHTRLEHGQQREKIIKPRSISCLVKLENKYHINIKVKRWMDQKVTCHFSKQFLPSSRVCRFRLCSARLFFYEEQQKVTPPFIFCPYFFFFFLLRHLISFKSLLLPSPTLFFFIHLPRLRAHFTLGSFFFITTVVFSDAVGKKGLKKITYLKNNEDTSSM